MEDKKQICTLLLAACQETRYLGDLAELNYNPETETVTATFRGGAKKRINVLCDSGFALMKDVLKNL